MTGAADIAGAAGLECLIGADLVDDVMAAAGARLHGLAKFVIEALRGEVTLLLGDPNLQPEMRRYDEFGHGVSSVSSLIGLKTPAKPATNLVILFGARGNAARSFYLIPD
jgi:hypothetical protein